MLVAASVAICQLFGKNNENLFKLFRVQVRLIYTHTHTDYARPRMRVFIIQSIVTLPCLVSTLQCEHIASTYVDNAKETSLSSSRVLDAMEKMNDLEEALRIKGEIVSQI